MPRFFKKSDKFSPKTFFFFGVVIFKTENCRQRKKGFHQRLLQNKFVYMHVLRFVKSVLANIASYGVQICSVSAGTVLRVSSWDFLKCYDNSLFRNS